ncbi:MAG: hypothetical protein RR945_02340 [Erysipelotrichaceae bacterium]
MFDLYDINGSKKIQNVVQGNRTIINISAPNKILDNNLIGAVLVVVNILYENNFFTTVQLIGGYSTFVCYGGITFSLNFDNANGVVSFENIPGVKSDWKFKGYSYIK